MNHKITPVSIEITHIVNTFNDNSDWNKSRSLFEGITIDGDESKDLDDAIWLTKHDKGWNVEVAIADVAHFIPPFGPLFEKVRGRQVSEYLSTGVKNMLPRVLSEDKLSLCEGQQKPALLFTIELDFQLEVKQVSINEVRFQSQRRMSYSQVANILNKQISEDPHYEILACATELSQYLVQKRRDKGALAFYDLKKGILTNENGQLVRIAKKESTVAYLIVQELMILANTSLAKKFAQHELPFIFRNHNMKAATPERDVLMDQYLVAFNDQNSFDILNSRMQLLANPAKYETVLNGHYGLNETAYAHLTSPIRRFADLVNHYQIKSFINKKPPVFSINEMATFCEEINSGNTMRREAKNDYFLSKAKKKLAEKAGKMNFGNLIEVPLNEFRKILKAGANMGKMRPELEEACRWRMEQNQFTSIDFYLLLTMAKEERLSPDLKLELEKAMRTSTGAASQIIQFLIKKEFFISIEKEIIDAPAGGFLARFKGVYMQSDTLVSTHEYSWEQNKRDALNVAAYNWVMTFFNDQFIKAEETKKPERALEQKDTQNAEDIALGKENFYGKLLELVSKTPTIGIGTETFIHEGTPHQPLFHYTIPFTVNDDTIAFEAKGSTKKLAKQKAAKKALDYLMSSRPDIFSANTKSQIIEGLFLESSNYPSILQVLLQQNTENSFRYEFEDLDPRNTENRYSSKVLVNYNGEEYAFSTTGPSKKEGRKVVAKMAIDKIFGEK